MFVNGYATWGFTDLFSYNPPAATGAAGDSNSNPESSLRAFVDAPYVLEPVTSNATTSLVLGWETFDVPLPSEYALEVRVCIPCHLWVLLCFVVVFFSRVL